MKRKAINEARWEGGLEEYSPIRVKPTAMRKVNR